MPKKKAAYYGDIKDTFSQKVSQKKVKKIAEDIIELQASFLPSESYKSSLKNRLENIYLVDELVETSPKFFSLKVFSAVFTVFFISVVLFMVHDMRQQNMQDILKDTIMVPEQIDTQLQHKEAGDIEKEYKIPDTSNMGGTNIEIPDTGMQGETLEDTQTQDFSRLPLKQDAPSYSSSTHSEVSDFVIEKDMPKDEGDNSGDTGDIHTNIDNESEVLPSQEVQNENIEIDLRDLFDVPAQDDTSGGTETVDQVPEDIESATDSIPGVSPVESMMFDGVNTEISPRNEDFGEVCKEYGGTLGNNGETCILETGKVCYEENIHSCVQEDQGRDVEEVLEDLSEVLGQ